MTWSIGLFTLGSLLCALSLNLWFMVAARIVQGAGGALMVPVGRLVILRLYPKGELVRVLSIIPIPGLFGSLIGPALGGFLVEYVGWHWIFLINIPVGLAGILATRKIMPKFEVDREHPFDWSGFLVFGLSLVLLSLALEGLGNPDFSPWCVAALAGAGLVTQAAYWLRLSDGENALFGREIFKTATFRTGLAANLFTRLGTGATPFLLPLLLQVVLGFSPLMAGLMMMPMALASVFAKLLARPLALHFKYRSVLLTNTILQGLLIAGLAGISMDVEPVVLGLHLAALGGINSLQFSFLNTYTLMDLSYNDSASGNSLMSVMIQLSQSLAVGVAATVLLMFHGQASVSTETDPALVLAAFHNTFLVVGAASVFSAILFFFSPRK